MCSMRLISRRIQDSQSYNDGMGLRGVATIVCVLIAMVCGAQKNPIRGSVVGNWYSQSSIPIGGNAESTESERIRDLDRHALLVIHNNGKYSLTLGSSLTGAWSKASKNYEFYSVEKGGKHNLLFKGVLSEGSRTLKISGDPRHPFWGGPLEVTFERTPHDVG